MTEQEEFEFRARAEAEQSARTSAPSAAPLSSTAASESTSAALKNTLGDELLRQGGLAGRAAANVIASPLTMGGDLIAKGVNAVAGREVFEPSSRVFSKTLDKVFPKPREGIESFTQNLAQEAPALAIPGNLQSQVAGNALVGAIRAKQGDEAQGAVSGALGATVGHALAKTLSSGLPGVSAAARRLMDTTDVQPTVGMAIPKVRALEEFTTGIPIIGEVTKTARQRAIDEFADTAIRKAVPGLQVSKEAAPLAKLDAANDYVDSLYHDVLPKVLPEQASNAFGGIGAPKQGVSRQAFDTGYAQAKANNYLTDTQQDILDRVYQARAPNISTYTGEQLKQLDSELGEQIRKYQRGAGTADLADALREMQLGLRAGIEARLPAAEQGKLTEANRAYRELIAVNDAASKSKDFELTPNRLSKAIALRDKKPVSKTSGPLAELARDSQQVLPEASGRGLSSPGLAAALAGTGSAAFFGHLPALAAGAGVLSAGSVRPVQATLLGNTAVQRALRRQLENNPRLIPQLGGRATTASSEE